MDILKIQKALNALNLSKPDLKEDGLNGPKTEARVKVFQNLKGLTADGIVGPLTAAKLFVGSNGPVSGSGIFIKPLPVVSLFGIAEAAKNIALSQAGVKEATGQNDGPAVEMFLDSVGLKKGQPWCMAFLYWCFKIAAGRVNAKNPLIRTGHCLTQLRAMPVENVHSTPEVNDIGIMDLGGGTGHCFMVTGLMGAKITTIEGNTNNNGSRNGNEVTGHIRTVASNMKFIRF